MRATFTWDDALLAFAVAVAPLCQETEGANNGPGVRWCQQATGNEPPASWCASYVTRCGVSVFGQEWPVVRSGACEDIRRDYAKKGALATSGPPKRGWQFFSIAQLTGGPHAHHTGLVLEVLADGFVTVEGNAAPPNGQETSNGSGAFAYRVRGNQHPVVYRGRTWPPDSKTYHFGNLHHFAYGASDR